MTNSQNGWPGIPHSDSPLLHKWLVPGTHRYFLLRNGSAGFLLSHYSLWFHEEIERLDLGQWDDWGWAYRDIRGDDVLSNHASGTAVDLNATRHPLGVPAHDTFTQVQITKISKRLAKTYKNALRSGIFYQNRPDGMHVELDVLLPAAEKLARKLIDSPRGVRILSANPGQKKVILS